MFLLDQAIWVLTIFLIGIARLADAGGRTIEILSAFAVAAFTFMLFWIARRADAHFRVTERAYVKMSHFPPGIYLERPKNYYAADRTRTLIRAELRVKNFGKTPAEVTKIVLAKAIVVKGALLTAKPDYSGGEVFPAHAFLVAGDEFIQPLRMKITKEEMSDDVAPSFYPVATRAWRLSSCTV